MFPINNFSPESSIDDLPDHYDNAARDDGIHQAFWTEQL